MSTVAGVIINLSGREARERYCLGGAYSYRQSRPEPGRRGWGKNYEAAIADYLGLADGDLVFFFERRQIFGIGRIIRLPGSARAVLCNYRNAWDLSATPSGPYLWENEPDDDLRDHPFVVFFEPDPAWYEQGIDMDEALASDTHSYVKQLPFFAGVSFARLDDFEAAHLAGLIRKSNLAGAEYRTRHQNVHRRAAAYLRREDHGFDLDTDALVRQYSEGALVRHEALLEAWLVDALQNRWPLLRSIPGRKERPTFLGRQVPASPFKPHEYIDRIDLLAYDIEKPTASSMIPITNSYLIAELKKDEATVEDVRQTLKYVDWIAHEHQGGDYAGITALIVSAGYPDSVREIAASEGKRLYVKPRRPYGTETWESLHLMEYRVARRGPAIRLTPA